MIEAICNIISLGILGFIWYNQIKDFSEELNKNRRECLYYYKNYLRYRKNENGYKKQMQEQRHLHKLQQAKIREEYRTQLTNQGKIIEKLKEELKNSKH